MLIGMDFGTTNSGMAVYDGHDLRLIPLDPSGGTPYMMPTALYITTDRTVYTGNAASTTYYEQNLNRPVRMEMVRVGEIELTYAELPTFIQDVFIERDIYSPGRLFRSFKMGLSARQYPGTVVGNEYFFLEDIIAIFLYVTRRRAEAFLGQDLDSIVLGRPVRFSDDDDHNHLARERLLQAAFRAGYRRVYLQYEPIAAAYHYEMSIDSEQNVLIFDFGGGTLDISILRLGNPKSREVLATGGIPIAGDIFDKRIVRQKLPQHFGEGTHYFDNNRKLPVPPAFYDAFENWQDLLTLNLPKHLESLKRIERTATRPRQIRAFINLITSNYALKLFDTAEAAKRLLSLDPHTRFEIKGEGFKVTELLTRAEFERIIRREIKAIAARLDDVMAQAGLTPDDIDVVIRTGGSSRIPTFVQMLTDRFGYDKVRSMDAFSSVTSGLGVIAHRLEQGEIDLPVYTPDMIRGGDYLQSKSQGGVPVLNLDMMKQLIDFQESDETLPDDERVLALRQGSRMQYHIVNRDDLATGTVFQDVPDDLSLPVMLAAPQDDLLLMTTDYRFIMRPAAQLADLYRSGTSLEVLEKFRSDKFSDEAVCAITRAADLERDGSAVLISTPGYGRLYRGERFFSQIMSPAPYQFRARMRGYPAFLVRVDDAGDLIVITHAGRAVRLAISDMPTTEQRFVSVPLKTGSIIGAVYADGQRDLIIATASGYARRLHTDSIPRTPEYNTTGEKLINRAKPVSAVLHEPDRPLYALTTQRLIPLDPTAIPLMNDATTDYRLLRPKKGEALLSLIPG